MPLPDGVGHAAAAALGLSAVAAWMALTWKARLRPGERVLVLGAGGVVGQVAVQVAAALGAARSSRRAGASPDAAARARPRRHRDAWTCPVATPTSWSTGCARPPAAGRRRHRPGVRGRRRPRRCACSATAAGWSTSAPAAGPTASFSSAALRSGSHSVLGYTNNALSREQRADALDPGAASWPRRAGAGSATRRSGCTPSPKRGPGPVPLRTTGSSSFPPLPRPRRTDDLAAAVPDLAGRQLPAAGVADRPGPAGRPLPAPGAGPGAVAAGRRSTWPRRSRTRPCSPSGPRRRPGWTSSPTARSGGRATPTTSPPRWTASTSTTRARRWTAAATRTRCRGWSAPIRRPGPIQRAGRRVPQGAHRPDRQGDRARPVHHVPAGAERPLPRSRGRWRWRTRTR